MAGNTFLVTRAENLQNLKQLNIGPYFFMKEGSTTMQSIVGQLRKL